MEFTAPFNGTSDWVVRDANYDAIHTRECAYLLNTLTAKVRQLEQERDQMREKVRDADALIAELVKREP